MTEFRYKLGEISQILTAYHVYEINDEDILTQMNCHNEGD